MPSLQETEHHIWCNFYGRPREGCKLCERLYERYPMIEGDNGNQLLIRHFPDVAKENGILPSPSPQKGGAE